MNIVISLLILCVVSIVLYFLFRDNKIEREIKQEQLNYYKNYNKLFEDDEKEEDNEKD